MMPTIAAASGDTTGKYLSKPSSSECSRSIRSINLVKNFIANPYSTTLYTVMVSVDANKTLEIFSTP